MGARPGALSDSDPERIAADIEQTRGEMTETIDAIQHRLDPERITGQAVDAATEMTAQAKDAAKEVTVQARDAAVEVTVQARDAAKEVTRYAIDEAKTAVRELADQAKTSVRASTVGKVEHMAAYTRDSAQVAGNDLMGVIRQNPIPAAIVAAGIGWLWMQRTNGSNGNDRRSDYLAHTGHQGGYRESAGQMAGQAQYLAGEAIGQAQQLAGQKVGEAQHAAGQMKGQAQHFTHQVTGQAQDAAGQMQYRAKSAVQGMSMDPLAIGALGLALGAVTALIIPETQREHQFMGETRDKMMERVQEMGGETIDKVQRVAVETGRTAMQQASESLSQEGISTSTT
jgi:hypothetical protein